MNRVAIGVLVATLTLILPLSLPGDAIIPPAIPPCMNGPAPDGATVYDEGFSVDDADWSLLSTPGRPNLWHWTTFAGNGSALDAHNHGDAGRLYYGIENIHGGTYNTSRMPNEGEIRSPSIAVPADGVHVLAIKTKWHVEFDRPWIIDAMMLNYAIGDGDRVPLCYLGNTWATLWNLPAGYGYYQTSPYGTLIFTGCEYALESPQNPCRASEDLLGMETAFDLAPEITRWESRYVALPPATAGQDVHVSFHFQTGDAIVDDAMGWMVDDVRVLRID